MNKNKGPKILFLDIETAPMEVYAWDLFDQNIPLEFIIKDWSILAWAAKWRHSDKVIYMDTRNSKDVRSDKEILKKLWELLDECDVVITQNGKRFDEKKINSRFHFHGMQPTSSYKHVDILLINKRRFGHTSNKLEYISNKFNKKYKKLKHKKFPGMELWKECLKNNTNAWKEMELYNKHDVLATEEYYNGVSAWDATLNFSLYTDDGEQLCVCGSTEFRKNGYSFTTVGKYQRYKCVKCGSEAKDRRNLLSPEKRKSLKPLVNR